MKCHDEDQMHWVLGCWHAGSFACANRELVPPSARALLVCYDDSPRSCVVRAFSREVHLSVDRAGDWLQYMYTEGG